MSGTSNAKIQKRTDWAPGLFTLTLDQSEDFTAGQFFNLSLLRGDKEVRRSYSAASTPGTPLEFFISEVPEGELTPGLAKLAEGDEVSLDPKALGFFTRKEVPPCKDLWLVATGTGIGPYLSMIREGSLFDSHERVVVVQGVRQAEQLAYRDEFRSLEKSQPKFKHIATLSGSKEEEDGALPGRITSAWDSGALEKMGGAFSSDSHMLLCGNPQMIADMVERLKERGYEKHRRKKAGHFNFEKYW